MLGFIATGEAIPLRGLEGVPGLPGVHLSLERTWKGILPLDDRHPTVLSPCPPITPPGPDP